MPIEDYEQTGVNPESQEQNTGNSEGQVAADENAEQAGEQSNNRFVPLEVVQSIREESKEWKDRAKKLENYIYQQQQQQQSQQQQQTQQSDDPLTQMDDDEFLTAGQARELLKRERQQSDEMVREVKMRQQYSDYDEVIGQHLPELIEKKPHLRDAILSSQDPYNLAYELGFAHKQYKQMSGEQSQPQQPQQSGNQTQQSQPQQPQQSGNQTQQSQPQQSAADSDSELNAALNRNSQKPGSLSQSSGGAQGAVSQADIYSGMSPMDFDEEIRRAKRGQ